MPLAFRVETLWPSLEGFEGILVMGPVTAEGEARVGDAVDLPTTEGQRRGTCTGFPLIRVDADKVAWVKMTVAGVPHGQVVVGGIASC